LTAGLSSAVSPTTSPAVPAYACRASLSRRGPGHYGVGDEPDRGCKEAIVVRITHVIQHKGGEVVTVRPEDTVETLLTQLAEHRIGALVVSEDGKQVAGIVSERDVVRRLH